MYDYIAVQKIFLLVFAHLNRDCFKQVDLKGQDMSRLSLQFTGIQKLH